MNKRVVIILSLIVLFSPLFAHGVVETISSEGIDGAFSLVREAVRLSSLEEEEKSGDESPVLSTSFSYNGFDASFVCYPLHAFVSIESGISEEDVRAAMESILSLIDTEKKVTFTLENGSVNVLYPEQDEESIRKNYEMFSSLLKSYLDSLSSPDKESAIASGEEREKVLRTSFSYRGIKTDIEAFSTYTYVYIPLGVTEKDVDGVVSFILLRDPDFIFTSFIIDGDKVVFSYPEASDEIVKEAVASLSEYLKAYIDSIFDAPSPREKSDKSIYFSFSLDAGVRGKFMYEKGTAAIFPTVTAGANLTVFSYFFLEANAEVMVYKNSSYLLVVGAADALAGLKIGSDKINVFGYGGARYTVSTKNSGFSGGFGTIFGAGISVGLGKYAQIKAQYEYFDKTSFYNVSLGIRF